MAHLKIIRWSFAMALMVAIFACQSPFLSYSGKIITEERRIAILESGPHTGRFQTRDIELDYTYTQERQSFNIIGTVHFKRKKKIWSFTMGVHFLDSTGAIINSQNLVVGGNKQMLDSMSFNRNLNFPSNSKYMSFSYSGTSSGTGNSGSPNDFWLTP